MKALGLLSNSRKTVATCGEWLTGCFGSLSEADDAVQETWLRLSCCDAGDIQNLSGWLTTGRGAGLPGYAAFANGPSRGVIGGTARVDHEQAGY
jgi:hypothetical protein